MKILVYDFVKGERKLVLTVEDVHDCRGNHDHCDSPATCEDCGHVAEQTRPVYVWAEPTDGEEFTFFMCAECIAASADLDLSA